MIVKEYYMTRNDGVKLYKTYSSVESYIKQVETGIIYTKAIDVENSPYTYIETYEKIPEPSEVNPLWKIKKTI